MPLPEEDGVDTLRVRGIGAAASTAPVKWDCGLVSMGASTA